MLRKPPTPKVLEKHIEKGINRYAKKVGVLTYKFTSPAHRGVPDRLFIAPGGKVGFLEIKRPGGKPTNLQLHELQKLRNHGVIAEWADTIEKGKQFIDALRIL
jgi:hypothetical protein